MKLLPPNAIAVGVRSPLTVLAPDPRRGQRPRESAAVPPPHGGRSHPLIVQRSAPGDPLGAPGEISQSFFRLAQAHVAESVQPVSAATITPIRSAKVSSYGMDPQVPPEKTSREGWSRPMGGPSASIGRSREGAAPPAIPIGIDAQAVGSQIMAPNRALEHRRLKALSPYDGSAWASELKRHHLGGRYPSIVRGLANGFDLGIPQIRCTYTPPNHHSLHSLHDVYNAIVQNEFNAGRYIGPFTRRQVEAALGPFQSSPLSLVPKTSKPGKFRAVHNFSHPHDPLPNATSINSHIDSDKYPCTWGTFATVSLLISRLPHGSQASVRDVAEAYRTIPVAPGQWPGLVIRLQGEDQYAINVCNNFGLTSAGGVYGMLADAGADIFRGNGVGPLAKWVDDHIFFRIPRPCLPNYNTKRAAWCREIQMGGGRRQEGSRIWYGGKDLPNGRPEEFDEDCSVPLKDLAFSSTRPLDDRAFSYADADIDRVSERLGIRWETSKSVPFGNAVPYLGFHWDLDTRIVHLLGKKKSKYLAAIEEWEAKRTHALLETQELYGKLLHASLVVPAGRAYLTSLEAMLGSFDNRPFLPRTPPRETPSDLEWWKQQLRQPDVSRPITAPQPLVDYEAYSDASSGFGVAITIGPRWRAWKLTSGWKSQGRDIQWAEAVGFELLAISICTSSNKGEHVRVHGDNRGVVEGWWKKSSANKPTNRIFRRVLELSEKHDRVIHTRYIPSAQNPADAPSRGHYPPFSRRLDPIPIPAEVQPFLIDV